MRGVGGEMLEGPWGSGAREEGLLLAWPSWLIWTSKPRVCSEDAGRSLPQRDRCPFDGEKKGCCTERVEEGVRGDGEDGARGREIQYRGRPQAELDRKGLWAREGLRAVKGGRVDGAAE